MTISSLLKQHIELLLILCLSLKNKDSLAWEANRDLFMGENLHHWLNAFKTLLKNRLLFKIYKKSCKSMFLEELNILQSVVNTGSVEQSQLQNIQQYHTVLSQVCSCFGESPNFWQSQLSVVMSHLLTFFESVHRNQFNENTQVLLDSTRSSTLFLQQAMDKYINQFSAPPNTIEILRKVLLG